VAGYWDRQAALVLHPRGWRADDLCRVWDEWKDKTTGEVLKSCTMLITEPNDFVAEVHDRMPVVLDSKDFASWLNDGGPALVKPAANDVLQRCRVSRRVNSSRTPADDPTLNRTGRGEIAGPTPQDPDEDSTGTGNG